MKNKLYSFTAWTFCFLIAVAITNCTFPGNRNTKEQDNYYSEQYRPQIHFSPEANWMNDPNGMVYFEGEYHLFYQYYPDSTVWGPMHWGHAVSEDLIHWEHLPIALYPDSLGYIFSGSAIIDWNNTSGFGQDDLPPMVAIYTYHDIDKERAGVDEIQSQGIAYSFDKGRTWTKYKGNPVLKNPGIRDFRDPKVIWHEESEKWIMILAVSDHVSFYSSSDLINWHHESDFGYGVGAHKGVWECPDLFQLKIQGTEESKWVLIVSINPGAPNGGSGTQYFVGDFNGQYFESHGEKPKWIDYGKDNYAGVTWSDVPNEDGRKLFIGWMNNWQYADRIPTSTWRGACTVPRELSLIETYNEYLILSEPLPEFSLLREKSKRIKSSDISGVHEIKGEFQLPIEIKLKFNTQNNTQMGFAEKFGFQLSNDKGEKLQIGYDNLNKLFFVDRRKAGENKLADEFPGIHYAPYIENESVMDMHLIIDVSSVELFAKDGLVVMTEQFFPTEEFNHLSLFSDNGKITLKEGEIIPLKSIW